VILIRAHPLNHTDKAYCWYTNNPAYKETYGALYTWAAVLNGVASSNSNPSGIQGVCPDEYHVPSDAEWIELMEYLKTNFYNYDGTVGGYNFGKSLADTYDWMPGDVEGTVGNELHSNNSTGFSALPAGLRSHDYAKFGYLNYTCWFWSSSEDSESIGLNCYLSNISSSLTRDGSWKSNGLSVRCVKD
jgi:uncharacterized protein (TIGR02145 family)